MPVCTPPTPDRPTNLQDQNPIFARTAAVLFVAPLLAATLLPLFAAPTAYAQRLDLGPSTTTPKPGDGLAALALADLLDNQASALRAPDEPARIAIRRLAARLLRDGENAGEPGSEAVLAGLTLASNRTELDALLASQDAPTRRYIAEIITTATPSIRPREIDLLLRDALAPLITTTSDHCGWWRSDPTDPPSITIKAAPLRDLIDHRFLSDDANTTLAQLIDLCQNAEHEPAYRSTAAEWADLVARAARALDTPADWLDMPARDRLRADLSAGLELLFTEPDTARASLTRTATLLDIINATDALEPTLQSRKLRDAANRLVAAPEGDPKRSLNAVRSIADAYFRTLELLDAGSTLPAPKSLVRQVRPMREPLARAHRVSADRMALRLPDILSTPDPMTEPGLLAATNALAKATADLSLPHSLSTMLTTQTGDPSRPTPDTPREPTPTRQLGALATRVQQLAVAAGKPARSDDALDQLRNLADIAGFLFHSPGEDELRRGSPSPEWRTVTGNQRGRLEFLLDEARADWILSAASEKSTAQTTRLRAITEAVELLNDGAELEALRHAFAQGNAPAINAWPGVELTADALDALAAGLAADLATLSATAARDNDPAAVLVQAATVRKTFPAALLVARLNRSAQDRQPFSCGPAAELALGPPMPTAWMRDARHQLAVLSRAAFEASTQPNPSRSPFFQQANKAASEVLTALP